MSCIHNALMHACTHACARTRRETTITTQIRYNISRAEVVPLSLPPHSASLPTYSSLPYRNTFHQPLAYLLYGAVHVSGSSNSSSAVFDLSTSAASPSSLPLSTRSRRSFTKLCVVFVVHVYTQSAHAVYQYRDIRHQNVSALSVCTCG